MDAFLCVEGGERQVFWKLDPSRARHGLGTAQLPTGPGPEQNSPATFCIQDADDTVDFVSK